MPAGAGRICAGGEGGPLVGVVAGGGVGAGERLERRVGAKSPVGAPGAKTRTAAPAARARWTSPRLSAGGKEAGSGMTERNAVGGGEGGDFGQIGAGIEAGGGDKPRGEGEEEQAGGGGGDGAEVHGGILAFFGRGASGACPNGSGKA
jgi:hypothetical protein